MGNFLSAQDYSVNALLLDIHLTVPEYQRPYAWGSNELDELWNDIHNLEEEYFIGSIVLEHRNHNKYDIIDGQQRLTTLSILIKVLYDYISEYEKNHKDDLVDYKHHLKSVLCSIDGEPIIFFSEYHTREAYKAILNQGKSLSFEKDFKKIIDNKKSQKIYFTYSFFWEKIQEFTRTQLIHLYDIILKKLIFVRIVATEGNARKIFRILNNTGLDLNEGDIVKSMFLKYPNQGITKIWDDTFIRDIDIQKFWSASHARSAGSRLDAFLQFYLLIQNNKYLSFDQATDNYYKQLENFTEKELETEAKKFIEYADIFKMIRNQEYHRLDSNKYPHFISCIKSMMVLETYIFTPLLMKYYIQNPSNLEDIAYLIENYLVRLALCQGSSSAINKVLASILSDPNYIINDLKISSTRYYNNLDIEKSLLNNTWNNTVATRILKLLEKKLAIKNDSAYKEPLKPTLEHIYPQNEDKQEIKIEKDFIYHIGNMCLLESRKNWGNSTFTEKLKNNYGNLDKFFTSEDIIKLKADENPIWGEKEIKNRDQQILDWCLEFWPDLSQTFNKLDK